MLANKRNVLLSSFTLQARATLPFLLAEASQLRDLEFVGPQMDYHIFF